MTLSASDCSLHFAYYKTAGFYARSFLKKGLRIFEEPSVYLHSFLNAKGVIPVSLRKAQIKWEALLKPQA